VNVRSPYRQNAFFLLDAPADATIQDIRRLQNRADVLLGMGMPLESTILPFLKRHHVSREDILTGLQKLEDGLSRIREELMWFHSGPKGDCMPSGPLSLSSLSNLLGTLAKSGGRQGAIATHNLAVLNHALCFEFEQEQEKSSTSIESRLKAWVGTLSLWRSVYESEEFWDFMSERVSAWADPTVSDGDLEQARREFPEHLLVPHKQMAAASFRSGAYESARLHIEVIQAAVTWITFGNRLLTELITEIVRHSRNQLDNSLLSVEENVLSAMTSSEKEDRLLHTEKEINAIGERVIVYLPQSDESEGTADLFGDQIGQCLRTISILYFNQLDDVANALRLASSAMTWARTESCKAQIMKDNEYLKYTILCRASAEFAGQQQYAQAIQKLEEARRVAPEHEKEQLEELLAAYRENLGQTEIDFSPESLEFDKPLAIASTVTGPYSESARANSLGANGQRKRVLVADHNEPVNDAIEAMLTRAGYEVRTTVHPSEVLTIVNEFMPDVAMIALIAPEIDGVKLSEQLYSRFPMLTIVLMSTMSRPFFSEVLQHLLGKGIACHALGMPFESEELLSLMQTWTTGEDHIRPINQ
jgi:CheY-like chemotaxis protein